jgi:phage shock protein PspC (stress-responsive transcriptional regulator)
MGEYKKLTRSYTDRMFGGVCGGLGEYLQVDSTLIRLIFVLLALLGGNGVLLYIIMLFIVPLEAGENEES